MCVCVCARAHAPLTSRVAAILANVELCMGSGRMRGWSGLPLVGIDGVMDVNLHFVVSDSAYLYHVLCPLPHGLLGLARTGTRNFGRKSASKRYVSKKAGTQVSHGSSPLRGHQYSEVYGVTSPPYCRSSNIARVM